MGKRLTLALAVAALVVSVFAVLAVAKGEKPFVTTVGNLRITANGTFSPTRLPKNEFAPIKINFSGKVETLDHTHPPAIKEVIVETDKNGAVNAKGLPVCTSSKLQAQTSDKATAACKSALIAEGTTSVEVEFPEQRPFVAKSEVLAFNGGVQGGVTKVFVHAYLKSPVSAAVVVPVTISKIHKGRYGLKAVAKIPKIAGGYGSPVSFDLKVDRRFTYKGKQQSYLLAKCPDGHLVAKGVGVFSGSLRLAGSLIRSCTPIG